jgi:hypothetical protein
VSESPYSRASQVVVESLERSPYLSFVRDSQTVALSLAGASVPWVRDSQAEVECIVDTTEPWVRDSQAVVEPLVSSVVFVRDSQVCLEVLIVNKDLPMPAIYPTLNLGYSVIKRVIGNFGVGEATSGSEVRVNFWDHVLWEWDLTYEYLPDFAGTGGITSSDLRALMGFYASTGAGFSPFCFLDVDDCQVLGQPIGTGDGTTTTFTLVRTFGLPEYGTTTEPVGYVNTTGPVLNGEGPFNVYVNGALQNPETAYTVVQTTPVAQYVKFTTAPAASAEITVDMSYYFWVRFLDSKYDFEKFMNKLWLTKKITLHSLRF